MSYWIFLLVSLSLAVVVYPFSVRPYLRKKKGQLSVDDEIPYIAIFLTVLLILALLTEVARYYFGTSVSLETIESISKATFFITVAIVYLGIILPLVFHLKYAGVRFTKPIVGNRAMFFIVIPFASVFFWSGELAEVIFYYLVELLK